jgi:hypothetical protein
MKKDKEWKPLVWFNGKYSAAKNGLIKTNYLLDKYGNYKVRGNIIKPNIDKHGYARVGLSWLENGVMKTKKFKVHRLVAMAFIPNPENKPSINHKDGNRLNNKVSNLEWCTSKENTNHAQKIGNMPVFNGIKKRYYELKGRPKVATCKVVLNTKTGERINTKILSERLGKSERHVYKLLAGNIKSNTTHEYVYEGWGNRPLDCK